MDLTPTTWPPQCLAHRGFSSDYPENSFVAFDAALEAPIQGIETDIQLSRDEQAIIYHDRTLHQVGGGLRRVRGRSLAELKAYDYGSWFHERFTGTPLPLLDEIVARYGQRTHLMLEIKLRETRQDRLETMMDLTIDTIHRHDLTGRASILCFDLELLRYGHERDPDQRYVWNQSGKAQVGVNSDFLWAYSLQHKTLSKDFVSAAQKRGKVVVTFTCDRLSEVRRAVASGVNGIMANDPILLDNRIKDLTS